jgi:hypothetical protein
VKQKPFGFRVDDVRDNEAHNSCSPRMMIYADDSRRFFEVNLSFHHYLLLSTFARVPAAVFLCNLI